MRDFIWIGDCVRIMLWLAQNPKVSGLFNCGTGESRTFENLAKTVFAALGREPEIDFIPTPGTLRDKYQYFTQAEMDRLTGAGYGQPFTQLEAGVAEYVGEYLNTDDPYI
jgi:ADP-L-glycero-D-manno-heptose 6-epimerase